MDEINDDEYIHIHINHIAAIRDTDGGNTTIMVVELTSLIPNMWEFHATGSLPPRLSLNHGFPGMAAGVAEQMIQLGIEGGDNY